MNITRTRQACAALAMMAWSAVAYADYLCETKERDPTPQQKEIFARGAAALHAAFLPPPEGWGMQKPTQRYLSGKFCPDFKNEPVTISASVLYTIPPTLEQKRLKRAADVAMRRELDELRTLPPDLQAQVAALEADNTNLNKDARAAEREKNGDLAKTKFEQARDASRKAYKIRDDHSVANRVKDRAVYAKYDNALKQDRTLVFDVALEANGKAEVSDAGAERIVFGPANVKTTQATDKIVRVVARFRRNADLTAENLAVLRKLIDRTKLEALVAGKLPSMEESNALMAKQNDAITQITAKAREQDKLAEDERYKEEAAARAAKAGVTTAPAAAATPAPTTTPAPSSPAAAPAAPTKPAPVASAGNTTAPTPPAKPPESPPATDPVKEVKDTVNKLKGLFGR